MKREISHPNWYGDWVQTNIACFSHRVWHKNWEGGTVLRDLLTGNLNVHQSLPYVSFRLSFVKRAMRRDSPQLVHE